MEPLRIKGATGVPTNSVTQYHRRGGQVIIGEMAILFCWQFVLLFVLQLLVTFCQFVSGKTFW
jgi:hypothetical protein